MTASQLNRQKEIESFAEAVLGGFRYDRVPVDVSLIAKTEDIILIPVRNSEPLFGRIEYHRKIKRFFLFHHDTGGSIVGQWQVRFSIAHELGHYYIPEHRHALMEGQAHSSVPGFVCDINLEREADIFASTLLIPPAALTGVIGRNELSLDKIESLARRCNISTVAAAVRASRASEEMAIAVLSNPKVLFAAASDEARALGFGWVERIPDGSATAALHAGKRADARSTCSRQWFPNVKHHINGWEEVRALGSAGLTLTLLLFDDVEDED